MTLSCNYSILAAELSTWSVLQSQRISALLIYLVGGIATYGVNDLNAQDEGKQELGSDDPDEIFQRAESLMKQGDMSSALELAEEALQLYEAKEGREHWKTRGARELAKDLRESNELSGFAVIRVLAANGLMGEVPALLTKKQGAEAIECFQQGARAYEETLGDTHILHLLILSRWAGTQEELGNFHEAEVVLRRLIELTRTRLGNNHPEVAEHFVHLGEILDKQGDATKAKDAFTQAISIVEQTYGQASLRWASTATRFAGHYHKAGEYEAAKTLCAQAVSAIESLHDATGAEYEYTLFQVSSTSLQLGQAELLGKLTDRIDEIKLGSQDPMRFLIVAKIKEGTGRDREAESLYRKAVLATTETDPLHADGLYGLGQMQVRRGSFMAIVYHMQALKIRKELLGENDWDYARSLLGVGQCYLNVGLGGGDEVNWRPAESYLTQARDLFRKLQGVRDDSYVQAIDALGRFRLLTGELAEAEKLTQEAMNISAEIYPPNSPSFFTGVRNMGFIRLAAGDMVEAGKIFGEMVARRRHSLQSLMWNLSEHEQLALAAGLRGPLNNLLTVRASSSEATNARYQHVMAWKGVVFEYQRAMRMLHADPSLKATFQDLQRVTAHAAKLRLASAELDEDSDQQRQLLKAVNEKEQIERRLGRESSMFEDFIGEQRLTPAELKSRLPDGVVLVDFLEYSHLIGFEAKPIRFERESRLKAFIVKNHGPIEEVDFGEAEPIWQLIRMWHQEVAGIPGSEEIARGDLSRLIRQNVWVPIEKRLGSEKLIMISPDGELGRCPFAAIPGRKAGSFLFEELSISVLPIPQLIGNVLPAPREDHESVSMLLVGAPEPTLAVGRNEKPEVIAKNPSETDVNKPNPAVLPDFTRQIDIPGDPALRHTADEIGKIAKLFESNHNGAKPDVLLGDQVTESSFASTSPGKTYLHIAAHGFHAAANRSGSQPGEDDFDIWHYLGPVTRRIRRIYPGLLSGFVFRSFEDRSNVDEAPEGDDDGLLTALEIAQLNLNQVDLAVLSGCETGLGDATGGEAVLGLERAFQVAGTRTTVASLWPVDNDTKRLMMQRFYSNLWERRMGKLEALREAQLHLLHHGTGDSAQPRYWAGWVLSGDPGDISFLANSQGESQIRINEGLDKASKGHGRNRSVFVAAVVGIVLLALAGMFAIRRRREHH